MREVVVLGGGLHPFGRFPEKSFVDLTRPAIREALDDAGVPFQEVQIAYCGRVNAPMGTGLAVVNEFGLTGIPIVNVEQACSSSSTAFRQAYWAIGQGLYDVALIVGFEKMERGMIKMAAQDSYEVQMGQSVAPAGYARKAQQYMHRHGATPEMFAQISVKSHKNGSLNPNAQYQKPVTLEEVLASRMIASPITLLQCSPTSDGASALVLASAERARKYSSPDRWMTIAGWAAGTEAYEEDPGEEGDLEPTVTRLSAELYERAGIAPADIDVVQVHDAFTPGEVLRLEAMGLVPRGGGPFRGGRRRRHRRTGPGQHGRRLDQSRTSHGSDGRGADRGDPASTPRRGGRPSGPGRAQGRCLPQLRRGRRQHARFQEVAGPAPARGRI